MGNAEPASILIAFFQSLSTLLTAYIPAVILGLLLGLLIGCYPIALKFGKRLLQFPVAVPLTYIVLFLMVTQNNRTAAILATVFSSAWLIAIYTGIGLQKAFSNGNQMALAIPKIFLGLRLGLTIAWGTVITSEAVLSNMNGLGFYLWDAYQLASYREVVNAIIAVLVVTFITDQLLDVIGILITKALKRPASD
jgi:ABC-type nitrate/sulfonate/bicarbonate transport system permease component